MQVLWAMWRMSAPRETNAAAVTSERGAALTSSPMTALAASYALLPGPIHLVTPFSVLVIMSSCRSAGQVLGFLDLTALSPVAGSSKFDHVTDTSPIQVFASDTA